MKYGKYNAGRMLPLAAFAAMAFATSCSNDSIADGGNQSADGKEGRTVELTASFDNSNSAATRVGMTKGTDGTTASLYWHSKDAILVQTTTSDGDISGKQFETDGAKDGDITATFSGKIADGQTLGKYAVYPYSDNHSFSEDEEYSDQINLTYTLPSSYEYSSGKFYEVKSNVFSKTDDGTTTYPTPCAIPMVGTVEDESNITFKHIGGLAVIRIDNMPFASGTMIVKSSTEKLSGEFTIEDLSVDNPEIENTSTMTSDSEKEVSFTFTDATTSEAGVFYLPLATGDYTDITIQLADGGNDKVYELDYGKLTVTRANVQAIALRYNSTDAKLEKDESSDEDGDNGTYTIDGHTFVDLGLSSGLLWAKTNIGAESETDCGGYYSWGETETSTGTIWREYKFASGSDMTKYYSDGKTTLEPDDDAAYKIWGSNCCMPSKDDFTELIANCTWTWDATKKGYTVASKTTSHSIFLPAGGAYAQGTLLYKDSGCYYWSKSLNTSDNKYQTAYNFFALSPEISSNITVGEGSRFYAIPIRPVAAKPE